jgi:acyl-coenzyme A thioesterase PaaI-like protein
VHGGVIAAYFDEVCGVAQSTTGNPGMTVNLTIDYRAPTPLHKPLEFRAHVASTEKRKIITTASLHHGETLCAEATGIFVSMRPEIFERLTQLRDA